MQKITKYCSKTNLYYKEICVLIQTLPALQARVIPKTYVLHDRDGVN